MVKISSEKNSYSYLKPIILSMLIIRKIIEHPGPGGGNDLGYLGSRHHVRGQVCFKGD